MTTDENERETMSTPTAKYKLSTAQRDVLALSARGTGRVGHCSITTQGILANLGYISKDKAERSTDGRQRIEKERDVFIRSAKVRLETGDWKGAYASLNDAQESQRYLDLEYYWITEEGRKAIENK